MPIPTDLFSGDDERAAAALGNAESGWLPELEAALSGANVGARWWAVRAMAQIQGADASAALLRASAAPDADVRAAAIFALGVRASPDAISALMFALADPSAYLARLASDALIHIGAPAVPRLIVALERDAEPRVRAHAARALAVVADTSAIPALFKALADESPIVHYWAEEGLERMGVGQVYFKP